MKRRYENGAITIFSSNGPLIFFHIPKTAGTTVSLTLKNELGDSMFEARSQKTLDSTESIPFNIDLISGHFVWKDIIDKFPKENLMTVIRDPRDRVISQYNNWRDFERIEWSSEDWDIDENAREAFQIARENALSYFLKSKNSLIAANCRNVMSRAFCGIDDVDPYDDDPAIVESAFENLKRFFWLGLTEYMDLSMTILAVQLGRPPLADGGLYRHNPTILKSKIDKNSYEELSKCIKLGEQLYSLVEGEFRNRLAAFLRASAWSNYLIDGHKECAKHRFHYEFSDINFLSGWSFEEKAENGVFFRWSLAGTEAAVMLPDIGCGSHIIILHVIGFSGRIAPSDIQVLLDQSPPEHFEAIDTERGWLLRYSFTKSQSDFRESLLTFSVFGKIEDSQPSDPRDNLGFALNAITIESNGGIEI